jgi:hypothetical protein
VDAQQGFPWSQCHFCALLTISLHLPPEAANNLASHAAVESFEFFAGRPPEALGSSLTLSLPPLFSIFLRHFLELFAFFQVFIGFVILTFEKCIPIALLNLHGSNVFSSPATLRVVAL